MTQKMPKLLGRDALLSGASFKRELVSVPELNGEIYLRDMGAPGVLAFNARVKELQVGGDKKLTAEISVKLMTYIISLSACDESGQLLFSESDVEGLANNNLEMLSRLASKALQISGVQVSTINTLVSEVSAKIPNVPTPSSSSALPKNSRKRSRKS